MFPGMAKLNRFKRYLSYRSDFAKFKYKLGQTESRFPMRWEDRYPCLYDNTGETRFDRHYIFHPAWAARILAQTKPEIHVDLSSSLHFCSLVSAFIPVRYFDYRPVKLELSNLSSETADLLALPFGDRSIQSLSCMHVVEHIGLGRYGDPLDPDGDLKAISELKRVVAFGGQLLFVVPIGKPKIMFNAHRIYSFQQILRQFSDFELKEFVLIPDNPKSGDLIHHPTEEMLDSQTYGCGCFWFIKKE